jgi:hypothetical protein
VSTVKLADTAELILDSQKGTNVEFKHSRISMGALDKYLNHFNALFLIGIRSSYSIPKMVFRRIGVNSTFVLFFLRFPCPWAGHLRTFSDIMGLLNGTNFILIL